MTETEVANSRTLATIFNAIEENYPTSDRGIDKNILLDDKIIGLEYVIEIAVDNTVLIAFNDEISSTDELVDVAFDILTLLRYDLDLEVETAEWNEDCYFSTTNKIYSELSSMDDVEMVDENTIMSPYFIVSVYEETDYVKASFNECESIPKELMIEITYDVLSVLRQQFDLDVEVIECFCEPVCAWCEQDCEGKEN